MIALAEPLTLDAALRLIAALRALVEQQAARLDQQAVRIAELEEKVRQNSSNSSKPPSSDAPSTNPKTKKKRSGKKRGGQPGHQRHERRLLPVEQAQAVTDVRPVCCEQCGASLVGDDPRPHRHQVFELPPLTPVFEEWRVHTLPCRSCDHRTEAALPDNVPPVSYGPGVDAMVGQLAGDCRLSKRATSEMMTEVFGIPMSTGAVIDAQNRVSEALAGPVEEATLYAQAQPIKNADETTWRQMAGRAYLWVCVTPLVTVFLLEASRAAQVAKTLLGAVVGVLGTDRYSGYAWWPAEQRQVCWAHLVRDFTAIAERAGSKALGEALVAEAARMFAWWKRVQEGQLQRTTFRVYMRPLRQRVESLLLEGQNNEHSKTAGTCRKVWEVREALWTFVGVEGVEPTNNAAERAVRFAVIWRKMCGGTQSLAGSAFVSRLLTARATLRQQGQSVHGFLRAACQAHRAGRAPPSLLPRAVT